MSWSEKKTKLIALGEDDEGYVLRQTTDVPTEVSWIVVPQAAKVPSIGAMKMDHSSFN